MNSDLSNRFKQSPEASATPAVNFMETPEFQAAVSAAVSAAIPALKQQLEIEMLTAPSRTAESSDNKHFAESLAMSIAQLTDQGRGPKPIAPELIRVRKLAHERMLGLIAAARKDGKAASYKLIGKVQFGGVIDPKWVDEKHRWQDTEIELDGIPNEAMVPTNDTAKEIYAAFMESIGSVPRPEPTEDFKVISDGIVVKAGVKRETATEMGESALPKGIRVRGQPLGKFVEKNILGTSHAPAIEMA